jgi:hypothetical protein
VTSSICHLVIDQRFAALEEAGVGLDILQLQGTTGLGVQAVLGVVKLQAVRTPPEDMQFLLVRRNLFGPGRRHRVAPSRMFLALFSRSRLLVLPTMDDGR